MKKNMNKKYYMITTVSGALLISMLTVNASQQRSRERLTGARIGQMQRGFDTLNLSQLRAYLAEATNVRYPNSPLVTRLQNRISALEAADRSRSLAQSQAELARAQGEVARVRRQGGQEAQADVAKVKQELTRDLAAQQRNFQRELAEVKSRNQREVQIFREQQAQLQTSNQEMQQAIDERRARATQLSQELNTARLQQGTGSDAERQEATARVVRLTTQQADAQRALETAHREQVARLEAEVVASRAASARQIEMLADRKRELMDAQSRASKAEQSLIEAATAAQKAQAALKSQEATNALVLAQATASAAELQKQLTNQGEEIVARNLAIMKKDQELVGLKTQMKAQDGKLRTAMASQKGGQTSQEVSRLQTELQQKEALVTAKEQQLQQEREAALTKLAKADEVRQADQQQALAELTEQTKRAELAQAEVERLKALLAAGQAAPADVVQAAVVAERANAQAQAAAVGAAISLDAQAAADGTVQLALQNLVAGAQNQVKQAEQEVVIAEKQLEATQVLADANPTKEQLSMAVLSDEQRLAKVKDRLEKWKKRAQATAAKKKEISAGYLADTQAQQEADAKAAQAEAARLANQNKSLAGSLVDAVVAAGETIIKGPMSQEKAALQEATTAVRWTDAQWTDAINQAIADSGLQGNQQEKYTILITKLAFMSANEDLQKTGEQLNVGFLVWRAIEKKEQKALQALLQIIATRGPSSTDDAVSILRQFVEANGGLVEAPRGYASRLGGAAIGAIELTGGAGLASVVGAASSGEEIFTAVVTPIIEASQELGVPAVAGVAAAGAVAGVAAKVIYSVGKWALGGKNLASEYIQAMAGKSEEECLTSQFKPLARAIALLEKTNKLISVFYATHLMTTDSNAKQWRRSFRFLLETLRKSEENAQIFATMLDELKRDNINKAVATFKKVGKSMRWKDDFTWANYLEQGQKWQAIVWEFVLYEDVKFFLDLPPLEEEEEKVATAQDPFADLPGSEDVPVSLGEAPEESAARRGTVSPVNLQELVGRAKARLKKVNFLIEPIFAEGSAYDAQQRDALIYIVENLRNEEDKQNFMFILRTLNPVISGAADKIATVQTVLNKEQRAARSFSRRVFGLKDYLNEVNQSSIRNFLMDNDNDPRVEALDAVEVSAVPTVSSSSSSPSAQPTKITKKPVRELPAGLPSVENVLEAAQRFVERAQNSKFVGDDWKRNIQNDLEAMQAAQARGDDAAFYENFWKMRARNKAYTDQIASNMLAKHQGVLESPMPKEWEAVEEEVQYPIFGGEEEEEIAAQGPVAAPVSVVEPEVAAQSESAVQRWFNEVRSTARSLNDRVQRGSVLSRAAKSAIAAAVAGLNDMDPSDVDVASVTRAISVINSQMSKEIQYRNEFPEAPLSVEDKTKQEYRENLLRYARHLKSGSENANGVTSQQKDELRRSLDLMETPGTSDWEFDSSLERIEGIYRALTSKGTTRPDNPKLVSSAQPSHVVAQKKSPKLWQRMKGAFRKQRVA